MDNGQQSRRNMNGWALATHDIQKWFNRISTCVLVSHTDAKLCTDSSCSAVQREGGRVQTKASTQGV
eukprot:2503996-Amphidinium_carterae.1